MNFCPKDLSCKNMYIIEFIIKQFSKKREAPTYNPIQEAETQDYESCQHTFMPIDSTGDTLSCTKCGMLAKSCDLKDKDLFRHNFFMNNNLD